MMTRICAALALALLAGVASAQNYRDSLGTSVQAMALAGSTGLDYSANQPTIPSVGANFGGTGPYANYVLVKTIPARGGRINVDVENDSGAQIAIVRDDGTAAASSAPVNASVFSLAPGAAAGAQGGSYVSQTFKGRLQIYAPLAPVEPAAQMGITRAVPDRQVRRVELDQDTWLARSNF